MLLPHHYVLPDVMNQEHILSNRNINVPSRRRDNSRLGFSTWRERPEESHEMLGIIRCEFLTLLACLCEHSKISIRLSSARILTSTANQAQTYNQCSSLDNPELALVLPSGQSIT